MGAGARICLGQIGAAHGVRGEMRLHSFTAAPEAIAGYGPLETEDGRTFEIESLRAAKNYFVVTLAGIRDRGAAERLTNLKLYVPRQRLPEPADAEEFYHADLIGLAVVNPVGERLGTVVAIHNFGAGDLIEVQPTGGGTPELLPFDEINVPTVDIRGGRIVVDPATSAASPGNAAEDGEANPSREMDSPNPNATARPVTRTLPSSRRRPPATSRKRSG